MNRDLLLGGVGEMLRFEGHRHWVQAVAFAPDGRHVLSGSGQPPQSDLSDSDFTVRLWGLDAAPSAPDLPAPPPWVVVTSPEPARPPVREERRLTGHADQVTAVAFLPDGRQALSASYDMTLRLWDLAAGRELRRFVGHADRVKCLAVAPCGTRALSGGADCTLRLWDLDTGRELRQLGKHKRWPTCAAFSPDGLLAVAGSLDGLLRLWEVSAGREVHGDLGAGLLSRWFGGRGGPHFEGHSSGVTGVAFDRAGRHVLSGSMDRTLKLWDPRTGKERRRFEGHTMGVTSAALSADGRLAVSGGLDGTVRLWDVEGGAELHRYEGHGEAVGGVAFSPDGRLAVSGGSDRTVRVWRLPDLAVHAAGPLQGPHRPA